jgi:glycerol uptake facilitator-like aquaporin
MRQYFDKNNPVYLNGNPQYNNNGHIQHRQSNIIIQPPPQHNQNNNFINRGFANNQPIHTPQRFGQMQNTRNFIYANQQPQHNIVYHNEDSDVQDQEWDNYVEDERNRETEENNKYSKLNENKFEKEENEVEKNNSVDTTQEPKSKTKTIAKIVENNQGNLSAMIMEFSCVLVWTFLSNLLFVEIYTFLPKSCVDGGFIVSQNGINLALFVITKAIVLSLFQGLLVFLLTTLASKISGSIFDFSSALVLFAFKSLRFYGLIKYLFSQALASVVSGLLMIVFFGGFFSVGHLCLPQQFNTKTMTRNITNDIDKTIATGLDHYNNKRVVFDSDQIFGLNPGSGNGIFSFYSSVWRFFFIQIILWIIINVVTFFTFKIKKRPLYLSLTIFINQMIGNIFGFSPSTFWQFFALSIYTKQWKYWWIFFTAPVISAIVCGLLLFKWSFGNFSVYKIRSAILPLCGRITTKTKSTNQPSNKKKKNTTSGDIQNHTQLLYNDNNTNNINNSNVISSHDQPYKVYSEPSYRQPQNTSYTTTLPLQQQQYQQQQQQYYKNQSPSIFNTHRQLPSQQKEENKLLNVFSKENDKEQEQGQDSTNEHQEKYTPNIDLLAFVNEEN